MKLTLERIAMIGLAIITMISFAKAYSSNHQLKIVQADKEQIAAELSATEADRLHYFEVNQELIQRLDKLQTQSELQKHALQQALQQEPDWANQKLPENIKKALAR